jgi:hypothetical protein
MQSYRVTATDRTPLEEITNGVLDPTPQDACQDACLQHGPVEGAVSVHVIE